MSQYNSRRQQRRVTKSTLDELATKFQSKDKFVLWDETDERNFRRQMFSQSPGQNGRMRLMRMCHKIRTDEENEKNALKFGYGKPVMRIDDSLDFSTKQSLFRLDALTEKARRKYLDELCQTQMKSPLHVHSKGGNNQLHSPRKFLKSGKVKSSLVGTSPKVKPCVERQAPKIKPSRQSAVNKKLEKDFEEKEDDFRQPEESVDATDTEKHTEKSSKVERGPVRPQEVKPPPRGIQYSRRRTKKTKIETHKARGIRDLKLESLSICIDSLFGEGCGLPKNSQEEENRKKLRQRADKIELAFSRVRGNKLLMSALCEPATESSIVVTSPLLDKDGTKPAISEPSPGCNLPRHLAKNVDLLRSEQWLISNSMQFESTRYDDL